VQLGKRVCLCGEGFLKLVRGAAGCASQMNSNDRVKAFLSVDESGCAPDIKVYHTGAASLNATQPISQ
jgi:hypothetical protein